VMTVDGERMGPADAVTDAAAPLAGQETLDRPFEGLKILDLGVIVVGAEAGRMFADGGADVVKVESTAFPDGTRQSYLPYPLSASFAAGHRNQRSLGLDLRQKEGRALFLDLVREADVLLSNLKPGTLDSLGLGADVLREANPRLVMADSSAFGPTGPWSRRLGYGPLVRAATGLTAQWVYPDEPGSFSDAITVYPAHVCARIGALGALALLVRRERTRLGGSVSIAQSEVMLGHFGAAIAAGRLEEAGLPRAGVPERDAPWGVFPAAGDDEWVAVTVRDDAEWAALCSTIGHTELLS